MGTGKVNPSISKSKYLAQGYVFHMLLMELIFDVHKTEIFGHFVWLFIKKHLSK